MKIATFVLALLTLIVETVQAEPSKSDLLVLFEKWQSGDSKSTPLLKYTEPIEVLGFLIADNLEIFG